MELQTVEDRIQRFLEKKFRASRSFATKEGYKAAINKFLQFLRIEYNLDLDSLLRQVKETKQRDPLEILDDFYSFLSSFKRETVDKPGFSSSTIRHYIIVTKEFLNNEGCHIYNEDLRQKFKLPKKSITYEKGLTKETINRLVRLSNAKLATLILMACSSGMRISELAQLRLSDIDFSTNPVTITIRKETTKTRQTRITHITSEATKALQDYLRKYLNWNENETIDRHVFLQTHEDRISTIREKLAQNDYPSEIFKGQDINRLKHLENQLESLGKEELYARSVKTTKHSFENQLRKVIHNIPQLSIKNDNGRNSIHFHAFRAWFKTQVTDAHQSDFAEALMGHTSLKLVYYRQNENARAKTYLSVEHALTISDTARIDKEHDELRQENKDLRLIVESLSVQMKNLERKIIEKF